MTDQGTAHLYCEGLPTVPHPENGPVLVTGATGYIGGRLVPELLARGYTVRTMVRAPSPEHQERWPTAETIVADASDIPALKRALSGVHTAYYLIHSLLLGPKQFEIQDRANAHAFRIAAEQCGVKRIIYLGGLGDVRSILSPHLRSRAEVADELIRGPVSTTVLRAAIIIGAGSASYEIVHHLVRNAPIFALPYWTRTRCQPIAIRDVIRYLVGALETPATAGLSFDIGGPAILTYEKMMKELANVLGLRRLFIVSPLSSIRLYSYVTNLLTPVPAPIIISLMEGLKNDVVCEDDRIHALIPFTPLSFRESIVDAMSREEQDAVHTRWSDAYPPAHELALKLHELNHQARYTTTYSRLTPKRDTALFGSICRIGGKEGWFHTNWMWRLRGILDKMLMGVGTARGRRSSASLRVNDVIDFWRVETLIPSRTLLLRAEMKLPGRAWLQFTVEPEDQNNRLSVKAYYDTNSLFGHLYWYIFLPFHWLIFGNLIRQIEARS